MVILLCLFVVVCKSVRPMGMWETFSVIFVRGLRVIWETISSVRPYHVLDSEMLLVSAWWERINLLNQVILSKIRADMYKLVWAHLFNFIIVPLLPHLFVVALLWWPYLSRRLIMLNIAKNLFSGTITRVFFQWWLRRETLKILTWALDNKLF